MKLRAEDVKRALDEFERVDKLPKDEQVIHYKNLEASHKKNFLMSLVAYFFAPIVLMIYGLIISVVFTVIFSFIGLIEWHSFFFCILNSMIACGIVGLLFYALALPFLLTISGQLFLVSDKTLKIINGPLDILCKLSILIISIAIPILTSRFC